MTLDQELGFALFRQVAAARPPGGTGFQVVTVISRPMWRRFMISEGFSPDDNPTEYLGCGYRDGTRRVHRSETIVVESEREFSYSRAK